MNPGQPFDLNRPLTTAEAAQAVNVNPHTVRKWRTRGYLVQGERRWLPVVDHDEHGNPRHRYGDLINAEQATNGTGRPRTTGAPSRLPDLGGQLRPIDWDSLDRQPA